MYTRENLDNFIDPNLTTRIISYEAQHKACYLVATHVLDPEERDYLIDLAVWLKNLEWLGISSLTTSDHIVVNQDTGSVYLVNLRNEEVTVVNEGMYADATQTQ